MTLSIEINDSYIKIIEASINGKVLVINKCLLIKVSNGYIRDGRILNIDYVSELIKDELVKNDIKAKKIVFVINSNSIVMRSLKMPLLKKESDIISMIKVELEQILPIDLNQYEIIYNVNNSDKYLQETTYIVYCIPLKLIGNYIDLSKSLKINQVSFDIFSNCLNYINKQEVVINNIRIRSDETVAFINIEKNSLSFSVVRNNINDFSKISYIQDEDVFIEVVAEKSIYDRNEISKIKHYFDEVSKYIRYYYSISKSKIDRIFVFGTSSFAKELREYLFDYLNYSTEVISYVSNVEVKGECKKNIVSENFLSLLALLNYENNKKSIFPKGVKRGWIFIFLVFLSIIMLVKIIRDYDAIREKEYMDSYIGNEDDLRLNEEITKIKEEVLFLQQIIDIYNKLGEIVRNEDYVHSKIIKDVFNSIPNDTEVSSILIEKNRIEIFCISDSLNEVSTFLHNLRKFNYVKEVFIPTIEVKDMSFLFTVFCETKSNVKLFSELESKMELQSKLEVMTQNIEQKEYYEDIKRELLREIDKLNFNKLEAQEDVLLVINENCSKNKVTISNISFDMEEVDFINDVQLSAINLTLECESDYGDILNFLDDIKKYNYIAATSININNKDGSDVGCTIKLKFYSFKEVNESYENIK